MSGDGGGVGIISVRGAFSLVVRRKKEKGGGDGCEMSAIDYRLFSWLSLFQGLSNEILLARGWLPQDNTSWQRDVPRLWLVATNMGRI